MVILTYFYISYSTNSFLICILVSMTLHYWNGNPYLLSGTYMILKLTKGKTVATTDLQTYLYT